MLQKQQRPLEVVCLAAPEDASFLAQWEEHLLPLQEEGYYTLRSAQHLTDEVSSQDEITEYLQQADLIFLLVSPHFFASVECLALMEQTLHRYTDEEAQVIYLLLRALDAQEASLAPYICLPSNGLPVDQWDDAQSAFQDCAQELLSLEKLDSIDAAPELSQEEPGLANSSLVCGSGEEQSAGSREDRRSRRAFTWSWRRAVSSLPVSLLLGVTGGLCVMLLYGLFAWLSDGLVIGLFYAIFVSMPDAFPLALLAGLLGALLGSALYGFLGERPIEEPTYYTSEEHEESVV